MNFYKSIILILACFLIMLCAISFVLILEVPRQTSQIKEGYVDTSQLFSEEEISQVFEDLITEYKRMQYIAFCQDYLKKYYNKKRIKKHLQLTSEEIETLANEIWLLSQSEDYKGDEFLPLAFASVETKFIPSAIGKAGEKSLFQIMEPVGNTLVEKYYPEMIKVHQAKDLRTDLQMSLYLWASYYKEIYERILKVNNTLTSEETIIWVSTSYNCGFWAKGIRYSVKNNISHKVWNKNYRKGKYNYADEIQTKYTEIKIAFEDFATKF